MERGEAWEGLASNATEPRLAAARWFADNATHADSAGLGKALSTESVPWIRRALTQAVQRAQRRSGISRTAAAAPAAQATPNLSDEPETSVLAKAMERVTEDLLHEISPMIGALKSAASREWDGFKGSDTERILGQATRLMGSLRSLNEASEAPKFEVLVLSEVVQEVITTANPPAGVRVLLEGSTPLTVEADRGKLEIAISNGLRNALEAVASFSSTKPPTVTIAWGVTAAEVWLVIKDSGPGFPGESPSQYKRRGATGKKDHLGHGLALATAVMESMGGEVIVSNSPPGAHFEIRWFRRNANSAG
jgi:signal transduction histidine kinase